MGASYTEPMKIKGQAFDTSQKFIHRVDRNSGKKLKHLRINFGGKFANHIFEKYTAKESIR